MLSISSGSKHNFSSTTSVSNRSAQTEHTKSTLFGPEISYFLLPFRYAANWQHAANYIYWVFFEYLPICIKKTRLALKKVIIKQTITTHTAFIPNAAHHIIFKYIYNIYLPAFGRTSEIASVCVVYSVCILRAPSVCTLSTIYGAVRYLFSASHGFWFWWQLKANLNMDARDKQSPWRRYSCIYSRSVVEFSGHT